MVPETPERVRDSTRPSQHARTMADTGSVTATVPASAAVRATVPVTSHQVPPHPPERRIELPEPETPQPYRLWALPSGMVPPLLHAP